MIYWGMSIITIKEDFSKKHQFNLCTATEAACFVDEFYWRHVLSTVSISHTGVRTVWIREAIRQVSKLFEIATNAKRMAIISFFSLSKFS